MDGSAPPDEWSSRRYPIVEDIAFQRRSWAVQRAGWCAMAVAVLLCLAGLFAAGPLSGVTASAPGLRVEAERFLRIERPATWRVSITPQGRVAALRINGALARAVTIEGVQPHAARAYSSDAGLVLAYELPAGHAGPLVVELVGRPRSPGILTAALGSGEATVVIRHLVYP